MEQFVVLPIVNKRSRLGYDDYLINLENVNYVRAWADDKNPDDKEKSCMYFNGSDKYLIVNIGREKLLEFIEKRKKREDI